MQLSTKKAKFLYLSLLLSGLYVVFQRTLQLFPTASHPPEIETTWQLVPSEAGFVLEIPNFPLFHQHLDTLSYWEDLQELPPVAVLAQKIKRFAQLSKTLPTDAKENFLLVGIPLSLNEWGMLAIIPLPPDYPFTAKTLSTVFPELNATESREYRYHPLYEGKFTDLEEQLTWTHLSGYLLVSFSSQTIELVLRQLSDENRKKRPLFPTQSSLQLYIDFSVCIDWWKKVATQPLPKEWNALSYEHFAISLDETTIRGETIGSVTHRQTWEKMASDAGELLPYLPDSWKNTLKTQKKLLKYFEKLRIQFSPRKSEFSCRYNLEKASSLTKIKLLKEQWWSGTIQKLAFVPTPDATLFVLLDEKGIHAFTPYRLLEQKSFLKWQVFLQDSFLTWKQIIYRNKHLWVASQRTIYKLNTTGELLKTYSPEHYPIAFIEVFQDKHQQTFLLVVDEKAIATLYDENGNPVPRWGQKMLFKKLHHPPLYVRAGEEEGILTLSAEGWIHFLHLDGTSYPNFPLMLREYLTPSCFIEKGNDLATSVVILLTVQGELLKLSLSGQLIERKKFHHPIGEATFQLAQEEVQRKEWRVVCQEENQFFVFDEKNADIQQENLAFAHNTVFQYFSWSPTEEFLTATDPTTQETFLWKRYEGKVAWYPLKNSMPLWMTSEKQRWVLVGATPHHLRIWSIAK